MRMRIDASNRKNITKITILFINRTWLLKIAMSYYYEFFRISVDIDSISKSSMHRC